jgi:ribosomal protein L15
MKMYELDFYKINRIVKNGLFNEKESAIDKEFLIKIGYIPAYIEGISLIANGKCENPVRVVVTRASKRAKEMLEESGGTLTIE